MSELEGTNADEEDGDDVLSIAPAVAAKKKKSAKTKKKKSKSSKLSAKSNGTETRTTEKTKGVAPDFAYEEASRRPSVQSGIGHPVRNRSRSAKSDVGQYTMDPVRNESRAVKSDMGQSTIDPAKNQSRSRTKSPESTPNDIIMSLQTLNLGPRSPSSRSLPTSFRENSARSERTTGSTRSLREPLHYKSPMDEKFKYMMAQLKLERQKADEDRNGLLALKGKLQREGSYKDVQSYMKKYMEGSNGKSLASVSIFLSPNAVDLGESYPLPWL